MFHYILSLDNENNYIYNSENNSFNEDNKKEKDNNNFLNSYIITSSNFKECHELLSDYIKKEEKVSEMMACNGAFNSKNNNHAGKTKSLKEKIRIKNN